MKTSNLTKLNYYSSALEWKENAAKRGVWLVIIHGDDGLFWLVSGKQARELEAKGYERAPQ